MISKMDSHLFFLLLFVGLFGCFVADENIQTNNDQLLFGREDLVDLSAFRQLIKHMEPTKRCRSYAGKIRTLINDQTSDMDEVLMKAVNALRQRQLPMNNRQPVLAELEDCLNLQHSEEGQASSVPATKIEVIAGKPIQDKTPESPLEALKKIQEQYNAVSKNVKDFGQDLYIKPNLAAGNLFGKALSQVSANGGDSAPKEVKVDDVRTQKSPDTHDHLTLDSDSNDDDFYETASTADSMASDDSFHSTEGPEELTAHSTAQVIPVQDASSSSSNSLPSDGHGPKWTHTSKSRSYSYSNNYDSENGAAGHAQEERSFSHVSSDQDQDHHNDDLEESLVKDESLEDRTLRLSRELVDAYDMIHNMSKELDEQQTKEANLQNLISKLEAQMAEKSSPLQKKPAEILDSTRFEAMKNVYENSLKREQDLANKVKHLESELARQNHSPAARVDPLSVDDQDEQVDLKDLAKELELAVDSREDVVKRCYKYYLALTLPGKITKEAIETIGKLNIIHPPMEDFYNDSNLVHSVASELLVSPRTGGRVAHDLAKCLTKPFTGSSSYTLSYRTPPGQRDSTFIPISAIPPMPPMPPMRRF